MPKALQFQGRVDDKNGWYQSQRRQAEDVDTDLLIDRCAHDLSCELIRWWLAPNIVIRRPQFTQSRPASVRPGQRNEKARHFCRAFPSDHDLDHSSPPASTGAL